MRGEVHRARRAEDLDAGLEGWHPSSARLDVNELFGLWQDGPSSIGKARLSNISLVHLDDAERDRFIADICQALHAWMITLDGAQPYGLLYIDECSPYLPPDRQPASKEPLTKLLRQARKYGLCCLLASQSPGDVDYKALGQVGTLLVGKLSTHQELTKIEPHLLAHGASREMIAALPRNETASSSCSAMVRPSSFRLDSRTRLTVS